MSNVRPEGAPDTFIWDATSPTTWTCPHCNRPTTITINDVEIFNHVHGKPTSDGHMCFQVSIVVCPNPDCRKTTTTIILREWIVAPGAGSWPGKVLKVWPLMPESAARSFDAKIPDAIIEDYEEACSVLNTSPKASATLARRCLQGMIRDFWGISKQTLKQEIDALQDKLDTKLWQAIHAVRSVGNIGAHMEKDVNIIVDVEPGEAQKLIQLIELLLYEWYVRREDRARRVQAVIEVANTKAETKADAGGSGDEGSPDQRRST